MADPEEEVPQELKAEYERQFGRPWYPGAERMVDPTTWEVSNKIEFMTPQQQPKKKKSGIPSGNAGEYFVMGELLRRGFDAQLADRNTKGYDLLAGSSEDPSLQKVQVKTVRQQPWFVRQADFENYPNQVTIYVLLGDEDCSKSVRYFIAKNNCIDVATQVHIPPNYREKGIGFIALKTLEKYEGEWETLRPPKK